MLKDCKGSLNGYDVILFQKGKEYDVNQSLFNSFVNIQETAIDIENDKKNDSELSFDNDNQENKAPKKTKSKKEIKNAKS